MLPIDGVVLNLQQSSVKHYPSYYWFKPGLKRSIVTTFKLMTGSKYVLIINLRPTENYLDQISYMAEKIFE